MRKHNRHFGIISLEHWVVFKRKIESYLNLLCASHIFFTVPLLIKILGTDLI